MCRESIHLGETAGDCGEKEGKESKQTFLFIACVNPVPVEVALLRVICAWLFDAKLCYCKA